MTTSISEPDHDLIRSEALRLGFDLCRFTDIDETWPAAARLEAFVAAGRHGEMEWMADTADRRRHPRAMWSLTRSAIVLGVNYGPDHDPLLVLGQRNLAAISVYAQGDDYHEVIRARLKTLARWLVARFGGELKVFVDTAPLLEKPLAERAGLGWQGKHTNLVSREHGSWLFLGEIYTTLELPPDRPLVDHCGSCNACQTACPTDAFPAPYRLDARRCISYLTIEHKGPVPLELRARMGNRIYGCDDCLAVCPWNKFARDAHALRPFLPRAELTAPELRDLLTLDDTGFRQLFSGSPIKRIGRNRFVRNCLYAAGNSGHAELLEQVLLLLDDADEVVAEAAAWAAAVLQGQTVNSRSVLGDTAARPSNVSTAAPEMYKPT
jgi:epoxyqueuosine reductase